MLKFEDFKCQFRIHTPKTSFFYVYVLEDIQDDSEVLILKLISITEKDFPKYKVLDEETIERFPTVKLSSLSKFLFFESLKEYYIKQC